MQSEAHVGLRREGCCLGTTIRRGSVFLSMLPVLSFFVWIWVLITVFIHIIRDGDLSGWLNAREAKVQAAS
jgi:hypothetical protein